MFLKWRLNCLAPYETSYLHIYSNFPSYMQIPSSTSYYHGVAPYLPPLKGDVIEPSPLSVLIPLLPARHIFILSWDEAELSSSQICIWKAMVLIHDVSVKREVSKEIWSIFDELWNCDCFPCFSCFWPARNRYDIHILMNLVERTYGCQNRQICTLRFVILTCNSMPSC